MRNFTLFIRNFFEKKFCILLLGAGAFFISQEAKSQSITNYAFTASSGTFTPLSGAVTPALSGGNSDGGWFNGLPVGFTFYYMGEPYTTVSASTDGWMTFDKDLSGAGPYNYLSTGSVRPIIAPLRDDNDLSSGSFSYSTSGTAGNRVFTAEWLNVEWNYAANTPVISFQVKLYEANSAIEFIYRQESGAVSSGAASIGIAATATGSGNFLSLDGSGASPAVSSTTETTTINTKPATGQTYTFTPPARPAAPASMTFSSVGLTTTTVEWTDNSTTEAFFKVYRSMDNVNFEQVGVVSSTTTAGTGTVYSLAQSGLYSNTLYYYRVEAGNEAGPSGYLTGSQATLAGTICGTKTVGPTGNYASLTAAFSDIMTNGLSCAVILELQTAYSSTVETFPLTIGFTGAGPVQTITVRPETGAAALAITSTAAQTLNLDGAQYIIFDGRPGGAGTAKELTIENASTAGSAIKFINNASNNSFTYVVIKGVTTSATSGVVLFSNTTAAEGNNNNQIDNSDLRDGVSTPTNLVYSSGTSTVPNTGNRIISNSIYNFFSPSLSSNGVSLAVGNTGWTISDNSFFQTTARTYTTSNTHHAVTINSTTGNNYTVSGNFIGGSAANAAGAAYTMGGTVATRFIGVNMNVASAVASVINNNTITNFSLATSSGAATINGIWAGVSVPGGKVIISNNTIGSTTGNSAIATTTSVNGGLTVGINSASSAGVVVENNSIGGITASGTTGSIATSIAGIQISSGANVVTGNMIGSSATANSFSNSASTGTSPGHVTGIAITGTSSNDTLSGNTISHLTNNYNGTSTVAQLKGIHTASGKNTITGNTIENLTASIPNASVTTYTSVIGISQVATVAGQTISGNTIRNLSNTNATAAVNIAGIFYNGSTSGTNIIEKNYIQGLLLSSSSTSAGATGIHVFGGASTYQNNMIGLGVDTAGASITAPYIFTGIDKNTTANNNFYFNTVSVAGSGVADAANTTQAFKRSATATDDLKNNIFVNTRSNASTGGIHYAINLNGTSTLTSDFNDLFANGTGGVLGASAGNNYTTLAAWQSGTGLDGSSYSVDPNFISATDLHIDNSTASLLESHGVTIASVTTDIDGDVRPGPAGSTNGGGVAPDIGADEFDGIPAFTLDMAAVALVSPSGGPCFGANQTVAIRIKNEGMAAVDFSVNPTTVNSNVTGPNPAAFAAVTFNSGMLAAGATIDTIVSTTYDMTAGGTYTFNASTTVTGDENTANDTMAPVSITADPFPGAAGTITGTASVCAGATGVAYSVSAIADATGYTWSLPAGATIATGANTNSITVDFSASATSGIITVKGTNACGNGAVSPDFTVTVNAQPDAAGVISGTDTVCQGATGVAYSAAAIANATAYSWTLPAGATIASGANTNSITVDFSSSSSSGNITVQGVNGGCTGTISADFPVTVNVIPDAAGAITGIASVCAGQTGVAYSIPAVANTTSYSWTLPAGATIASGANTNSVTVDFSGSASSGNITVQGINAGCSGVTSPDFAVDVTQGLPVAAFTDSVSGSTVILTNTSSNATGFSWDFGDNSTAVTTTSPTHTYAINGAYTIVLTATNACGSDVDSQTVNITVGVKESSFDRSFKLYPNPTNGEVTYVLSEISGPAEVKLTNAAGQVLYLDQLPLSLKTSSHTLNMEGYARGVYFLHLIMNNQIITKKVVLQ